MAKAIRYDDFLMTAAQAAIVGDQLDLRSTRPGFAPGFLRASLRTRSIRNPHENPHGKAHALTVRKPKFAGWYAAITRIVAHQGERG